jgi:phosphomevalonate kinase
MVNYFSMEAIKEGKSVTTHAPGKLILLGEYAVLEDSPALVSAVDRFAQVHIQIGPKKENTFSVESDAMKIHTEYFKVNSEGEITFDSASEETTKKLKFFKATFTQGWKELKEQGLEIPSLHIFLDTSEFFFENTTQKLGFGSSAALTVALLSALAGAAGKYEDAGIDRSRLYSCGMESHFQAQGRMGSGIDIAAATWGGIIHYKKPINDQLNCQQRVFTPETSQLVDMPKNLHILPIWTGKPACTRELVASVYAFKEKDPNAYQRVINEMGEISLSGIKAFSQGDTPGFLQAAYTYGNLLQQLGELSNTPIYSREHQQLARIVGKYGAVYKPSGAGGGDMGIALTTSISDLEKIITAAKQSGYIPLNIHPIAGGVYIQKEIRKP